VAAHRAVPVGRRLDGRVDDDLSGWSWRAEELSQEERAAGYQEWADFYEWRLKQRSTELAGDRGKRHLVEQWTDSMAYCCRRLAIQARGDDPGEWVSRSERRPDLDAEREAIVLEIIAKLDADRQSAGQLAMAG